MMGRGDDLESCGNRGVLNGLGGLLSSEVELFLLRVFIFRRSVEETSNTVECCGFCLFLCCWLSTHSCGYASVFRGFTPSSAQVE